MAGHADVVTGFLPKSHENYHEASVVYTYDPEKAKALLAEAGVENLELHHGHQQQLGQGPCRSDPERPCCRRHHDDQRRAKINWSEYAAPEDGATLAYDVMLTPGDPTCFGNDPDLLMSWWNGDNIWTQGRSCWKGTEEWTQLQELMQEAREANLVRTSMSLWNQCFEHPCREHSAVSAVPPPGCHRPTRETIDRRPSSPSQPPVWSSSAQAPRPSFSPHASGIARL